MALPDRRDFLSWSTHGLTMSALLHLLQRDGGAKAAVTPGESADPPPPLPAKCRRVIHLYMAGGPSHLELFDYKPELERLDGAPMPDSFTKGQPIAQLQDQIRTRALEPSGIND